VGGGHAGGTTAALLRQNGFDGDIVLIGAEPGLPYERPPLSKAWLEGLADTDSLLLKPASFYTEQAIDLLLQNSAVEIDRSVRTVGLADGRTIGYDRLVLATGTRARRLDVPGHDLDNVLYLRDHADAERVKAALGRGGRIVVCGGGYVGLEVAATARQLGLAVTVVEQQPRLLSRVASPSLAAFYLAHHVDHGVAVRLSARITSLVGRGGVVAGVELAGGEVLPCDAVVVGIGAVAQESVAVAAGLDCSDGIIVDGCSRTSDPRIFAVGDVARRPVELYGRSFRFESVPNVVEQAKQVAAALTGRPAPRPDVPWFWSDQYDTKLQIAGMVCDTDSLVIRGVQADGRFAVFHLRGDRLMAVEAVNSPAEFVIGKKLIAGRRPVLVEKLADSTARMTDTAA
jgi:3-phenylpropionate/trans-cinnamate dioxygenase ferredoxin reductase subunit